MDPNYTKRRAVAPLPPELWLRIFRHATHVPGTLVPDIYDNASILGHIFVRKFHPALRKALITKRALVLVCRQWCQIASPILYESVYIRNTRCLSSLCSTLERSAEGKGTVVGTQPLGDCTQRLDIVIADCAEQVAAECDFLEDLIACMPHLAIFSIASTNYYAADDLPCSILNGLLVSAHSLRVLDWSSPNLQLPVFQIRWLLNEFTQLRVLNCPQVLLSTKTDHVLIPPTVTTLCLGTLTRVRSTPTPNYNVYRDRKGAPTPAPLPVLQELVLDFSEGDCSWDYLFDTYGPQLISVHLYKPHYFVDELCPSLDMLARTCPNLRRLTITDHNFRNFVEHMSEHISESSSESSSESIPESISESSSEADVESSSVSAPITNTYLGLRVYHSSREDFEALFEFLEYLRPRMPSLQVVQLLNERNVRCLLKKHTKFAIYSLRQFMEADATVRLEDKDGVLLIDRLKALGHG